MVSALVNTSDWVQQSLPDGCRTELRLEKAVSGEFTGMADDQRGWLAVRSRSGRLEYERPPGEDLDIPTLPTRSLDQAFITITSYSNL
jgi:hypothetical protein